MTRMVRDLAHEIGKVGDKEKPEHHSGGVKEDVHGNGAFGVH